MADVNSFWEDYEQEQRERSSGGLVGKITVTLGWKTFAPGVPQEQTFFQAPPVKRSSSAAIKKQNEDAKQAATEFGTQHGAARDPDKGLLIRMSRADAWSRGQPATWWKTDRFWFRASYTDGAKVMFDSIRDSGITNLPWEGYARIGFVDDPYDVAEVAKYLERTGKQLSELDNAQKKEAGMRATDADGNQQYTRVPYVVEVFESREAAEATVTGQAAEAALKPSLPATGWSFDGGQEAWEAAVTALKERGAKVAVLAELRAMEEGKLVELIGEATVEDVEAWWEFV